MNMFAGRLFGRNDFRIETVTVPDITEDEILLEVKAAALCGSDLRMIKQGVSGISEENPLTLGHEFSGVINRMGSALSGPYKTGQRVAVAPNFGCGLCDLCTAGHGHLCAEYQAFGINLDGAFAEYVKIPAKAILQGNVTPIADSVSYSEAAINEPLACVENGFERNNIKPGDKVLIMGAGAIGIMHAKLAQMAGAGLIVMNDLSEERLSIVKAIFNNNITTIDGTVDIELFTQKITDQKGFDVIVTAAPVPQIQQMSLKLAAINGRICFFGGLPGDRQPVALDTNLIHYRQLIVSGTTRSSLRQYRKTLSYLADGLIELKSLITSTGDLHQLPSFITAAEKAHGIKYVVVFP